MVEDNWYRTTARKHAKRRLRHEPPCQCSTCHIDRAVRALDTVPHVPACIQLCLDVVTSRYARTVEGRPVCIKQAVFLIRVYALLKPHERALFSGLSVHAAMKRALDLIQTFTQ